MLSTSVSLRSFLQQNTRQVTVVFILFVLANIAIYAFTPSGSYLAQDTTGYLESATRLVEEGTYASELRLPGYPIFIATILLFTDSFGGPLVAAQCIMLFAIAVMTALLAEQLRPNAGIPALTLMCFNPSTLYYAQKTMPDLLFAFLFIIYFYFLIQSYRRGSLYSAIFVGVAAGLAAIVRGNGHYLLFTTPLIIIIGYRLANTHWPGIQKIYMLLISAVAAMLILAPWFQINAKAGNESLFISDSYKDYVIHDNIVKAVSLGKSITFDQATKAVYVSCMQREDIPVSEWELFDRSDKHNIVARNAWPIMANLNLRELTLAMSKALTVFFITSEGRGWSQLVQQDTAERIKGIDVYQYSMSAILQNNPVVSVTTKTLHFLSIAFYVLIYLFCFTGLFYLVRASAWDMIFSLSVCIILFAGTSGFIGYSRYRLPLEPLIICLASIGLPGVMHWLRCIRARTN